MADIASSVAGADFEEAKRRLLEFRDADRALHATLDDFNKKSEDILYDRCAKAYGKGFELLNAAEGLVFVSLLEMHQIPIPKTERGENPWLAVLRLLFGSYSDKKVLSGTYGMQRQWQPNSSMFKHAGAFRRLWERKVAPADALSAFRQGEDGKRNGLSGLVRADRAAHGKGSAPAENTLRAELRERAALFEAKVTPDKLPPGEGPILALAYIEDGLVRVLQLLPKEGKRANALALRLCKEEPAGPGALREAKSRSLVTSERDPFALDAIH